MLTVRFKNSILVMIASTILVAAFTAAPLLAANPTPARVVAEAKPATAHTKDVHADDVIAGHGDSHSAGSSAAGSSVLISKQAFDKSKQDTHLAQQVQPYDGSALAHYSENSIVVWVIALGAAGLLAGLILLVKTGAINNIGIGPKLYGSHGALVILAIVLWGLNWHFQSNVEHVNEFRGVVHDIDARASEMGRHLNEFLLHGLEDKQRGEESLVAHDEAAEQLTAKLNEVSDYNDETIVADLITKAVDKVEHHNHAFKELTDKFHEVELIKIEKSAFDQKIQHALEGLLTSHKDHLHALERSGKATLEQVESQSEVIFALEEAEIQWLKVFSHQNEYMLDKEYRHVAAMEQSLQKLETTLIKANEWLVKATSNKAQLDAELAVVAEIQNSIVDLQRIASTLVHDELIVGYDLTVAQADITTIKQMAGALSTHAEARLDNTRATAQTATIASLASTIFIGLTLSLLLVRSTSKPIYAAVDRLKHVASGDLTAEPLTVTGKDELAQLTKSINEMSTSLHEVIAEVSSTTHEVAGAATQIAASSEEMAQGMGEQNQQVTQISAAVEEMSASVIEVARKSGEAANNAQESGRVAQEGGQVVTDTIHGMNEISEAVSASAASVSELGKRGEQIGQIIEVINDIADQTNLLALNAAIEAARAGEHGRGFAVVADEVRKLADRTTKATEEIGDSITAIQTETNQAVERMTAGTEQVQVGVQKATQAGQSLEQIVAGAQEVAGMIQSIAAAAEEQSAAAEQVSRGVQQVSAVTNQSAEGAGESAMAANQLSEKAEQLQALVGRFKL